jgi:hypothetical protein
MIILGFSNNEKFYMMICRVMNIPVLLQQIYSYLWNILTMGLIYSEKELYRRYIQMVFLSKLGKYIISLGRYQFSFSYETSYSININI